jgi:hypothetical protein
MGPTPVAARTNNKASQKSVVVVLRRKRGAAAVKVRQSIRSGSIHQQRQQRPVSARKGLPSFKPPPDPPSQNLVRRSGKTNEDDDDGDDDFDDDVLRGMDCDTMLVVQDLLRSNETCLELPYWGPTAMTTTATTTAAATEMVLQGVLECQIHERLTGSSVIVSQELSELLRRNQLRKLSSPCATMELQATTIVGSRGNSAVEPSVCIYVGTDEYKRAVRTVLGSAAPSSKSKEDNTDAGAHIVDWFLEQMDQWTTSRISKAELVVAWAKRHRRDDASGQPAQLSGDDVIQWLQDHQILLVACMDHSAYQLWFPTWGSVVLPALYKAKTDALAFVRQSKYKERSVVAVVQRLKRSPVAANGVLLPWLVSHGYVQRIHRPAGSSIRLARAGL